MALTRTGHEPAEVFRRTRPVAQIMRGTREVWNAVLWPKTGSAQITTVNNALTTVYTFTSEETGYYQFDLSLSGEGGMRYTAIVHPGGVQTGTTVLSGETSTATWSGTLTPGQQVELQVYNTAAPATASWTIDYLGEATLPQLLNIDSAKSSKYRVAFAGSSTMQGWGQPRYESTAHLLTAHLVRHVPGANATRMVPQTGGSLAGPTLPGFHFLNAALGGTTSANYLDATKRNLVNGYGPDLLIHMVGSNDYSEQVAPATYKSRMKSAIQSITGVARHVLVHQQRREDRSDTGHTWAQYGQALTELSDELPNVYFVDVSQRWHTLRDGATDWFAADNIHCTWKGSEGLARAIAEELELETHVGETVWAVDPDSFPPGNEIRSLAPTAESLVQLPATDGGRSVRPSGWTTTPRSITFAQSGASYLDTAAWGAAYSFPLTFYVVVKDFPTNTSWGTLVQPWFSRSVNNDDGWWWAWRDRGSTEVRAALNSAFSGFVNYGSNNYPVIIAVHMTANNRAHVWANSRQPLGVLDPDRIAENPGPWMKSLRIGANSSAASYTAGAFHEMRWELAGHDIDQVGERMEQLAAKYGATIY